MAVFPDVVLAVQWVAGPPYELIDSIKMTARVDANFNAIVPRVADTGWLGNPALGSGWSATGSGNATPTYRLKGGIVYCHGMMSGGTTGALFTLPVGLRPLANIPFVVLTNGGTGRIDVSAAGVLTLIQFNNSSNNAYMSLDTIHFIAEQ